VFGHHAFRCSAHAGNANTRHKWVNFTLWQVIADAGITAQRNTPYEHHFQRKLNGLEPDVKHSIDTLITTEVGNLPVDVTIRQPRVDNAWAVRGKAAEAGEKEKVAFISERYVVSKDHIIPFAIETYGVFGEKAKQLIRALAKVKAGENNRAVYAQYVRNYRARIGVAVQRGNGVAINRWRAWMAAAAGGGGEL